MVAILSEWWLLPTIVGTEHIPDCIAGKFGRRKLLQLYNMILYQLNRFVLDGSIWQVLV